MPVQSHDEAERLAAAWQALTTWLAQHAPTSYASLLPPATEEEIATADSQLMRHVGYGLPAELAALWRLCGGVEHQYIEENEEAGEVGSGAFLPGGVILLSPAEALGPRLPQHGQRDGWGGVQVVPWLTRDEAGPLSGHYAGADGVGRWSNMDQPVGEPAYPSIAAYFETVHRALTEGLADLMGDDVPGLVWGCLIWDNPEFSALDDAAGHWTPIH
ncbi:hypothetical protein ABTZ59_18640 [Streptomyces sp. NPDC094034]|uniref:hypothetical protein n=1 Tax=Streptomyces sp. NPDC094034 TaxID=3155309 RepID=UPI00331FE8B7